MDIKLAEYRSKKKREQLINSSKDKLYSLFRRSSALKNDMDENTKLKDEEIEITDNDQESVSSCETNDSLNNSQCCDELTYSKVTLYASLWLILFSFAVYLEFGAVYFVISGLYIVWANTRTGPKTRGEVSAYSVFNPNCEAIDGTLKAEQFEREIRYGPL